MLNRIIDDLRIDGIRPSDLAKRAKERLRDVREEGVERLWTFQADALEQIEDVLHRAPENVPVLSRVADAAERAVARRLEVVTALPVEKYDEMNAKEVRTALKDLGHVALLKVRRHEATKKNRKSVLSDIDKEIARRTKPSAAEAASEQPEVGAES